MTFVGFSGLLLGLAAFYIAELKSKRGRLVVFVLLFVLHALASSAYYTVAVNTGSDAHLYYYDPYRYAGGGGLGTAFILNLVQRLKDAVGGTFFDYFLLFQAIGFWGLILLMKTFNEIFEELEIAQPNLTYLPLFLPGLHFWTGAIGKDAPLFFAVSLAIWASMRFNKRLVAMGIAVAIMLAARPHVALLVLIALPLATLIDRRTKLWIKIAMVVGVISASVLVVTSLQTDYRMDLSSVESVGEYMSTRGTVGEESGAEMSVVNASFPVKILSLWFRPFFLDAENSMGYIASLENLALLLIFMFVLRHWRLLRRLSKKVLYIRFSILFFVALTLLLAAVNFNVGLGLRQKMMAMPCLLVILTTLIAVRLSQRAQQRELAEPTWQRDVSRSPAAYPGS